MNRAPDCPRGQILRNIWRGVPRGWRRGWRSRRFAHAGFSTVQRLRRDRQERTGSSCVRNAGAGPPMVGPWQLLHLIIYCERIFRGLQQLPDSELSGYFPLFSGSIPLPVFPDFEIAHRLLVHSVRSNRLIGKCSAALQSPSKPLVAGSISSAGARASIVDRCEGRACRARRHAAWDRRYRARYA